MSKNNLQEIPSGGDRPKGSKPEPTPLSPLRRLQAADEVAEESLSAGEWAEARADEVARPLPKPLPNPKRLEETYKGLLPRRWVRPLPEPSEGMPIGGFPPLAFREKVFFTCLIVALGSFLFMYARASGAP